MRFHECKGYGDEGKNDKKSGKHGTLRQKYGDSQLLTPASRNRK
jgi:hypothetical protein